MHHRNRFRNGYEFNTLVAVSPALSDFVRPAVHGRPSIDFADPDAVTALNRALLLSEYHVRWDIPAGALCPPIPGRLDYLHHLADLIGPGDPKAPPRGRSIKVIDIGSGANSIYPILGASEFGWSFVATEVDRTAMRWARQVVRINRPIASLIEHRLQSDPMACFAGVTHPGERFHASMCNPPFHASARDAAEASERKRRNLKLRRHDPLNFGGRANELWCPGGEAGFIERMIAESARRPGLCGWFTTLVSKSEHLPALRRSIRRVGASDVKTIDVAQGQKKARILAWTFQKKS